MPAEIDIDALKFFTKSRTNKQRWSPQGRPWPRGRFEVFGVGFGLEASSPQKLACPRLEDSSIF